MRARAGRFLVAAVLVVALGLALVGQGEVVRRDIARIEPLEVLIALVLLLAGLVLSMLSWRTVLGELGSPLPIRQAGRIFFVGQIGKYVPGSVWPLLTQAQLGKRVGVSRTRMVTAGLVAIGLSVSTGLITGLLVVGALLSREGQPYLIAFAVLLPVALVGLHPAVLTGLLGKGLRLSRREPLERPLSARGVAAATGLLFGCWTMFGLQAWVLVRAVGAEQPAALPLAVGAFALASTLGLLFLVAPAGAGVREAVLVLGLAPVMSTGSATTVALVSRLLTTVADGLVAAAALLAARRAGALGGASAPAADVDERGPHDGRRTGEGSAVEPA